MQQSGRLTTIGLGLLLGTLSALATAKGQATPTATAGLQLSAFGGVTGTYTGVKLGRNLSITAGADATFHPFFGIFPSIEIRGTYPILGGGFDSQKNLLGGLKISKHVGWIQPYGDFLAGRGEIDFHPPIVAPSGLVEYEQTASAVFAGGGGADLYLLKNLGFKGDFQFQHYASPVNASGSIYAKAFTLGLTYRLPFGGLGRR